MRTTERQSRGWSVEGDGYKMENTKYYSSSSTPVIEVAVVVEMMVKQQQTLILTLTVAGAPTMSNTNYGIPVVPKKERND